MSTSFVNSAFYERARQGAENMYFRARSLVRPYLEERICFLHFQKCGGTSVRAAIERAQMHWKRWKRPEVRVGAEASRAAARRLGLPLYLFREQLLHYLLARDDIPLVAGHVQLDRAVLDAYRDRWAFVTMLREPVRRWISHYFYHRYKAVVNAEKIDLPLADYLGTQQARFRGQDYARLLSADGDRLRSPARPTEDDLERAKRTLDAFDGVGVLEDLPGFLHRFEQRFGVRLPIRHERANPASKQQRMREVSPAQEERIRNLCRPNIAIYEYAQQLLKGSETSLSGGRGG